MSEHVEEMLPPVAWTTRSRSAEETLPAQKMSRSAKYLREVLAILEGANLNGRYLLCGQITNWQFTQHNLGTGLVECFHLVVNNLPLSIHNGLVF